MEEKEKPQKKKINKDNYADNKKIRGFFKRY